MTDEQVHDGFDARRWLEEKVRTTPFWAISGAFHALLLAALGLVQFAAMRPATDPPSVITVASRPVRRVDTPEGPRAALDRPASDASSRDEDEPQSYIRDATESDRDRVDIGNPLGDETWAEVERDSTNLSGVPGLERGVRPERSAEPSWSTSMGLGPGGRSGGHYGRRGAGSDRNTFRRRNGGDPGTESAVAAGLRWLARHQGADGGWHAEAFAHACAPGTPCAGTGYGQFDVGLTSLALLAFLGDGHTQASRHVEIDRYTQRKVHFGDVVRRAHRYLARTQDEEGCVGPRTGEFMYNHAIATLALAEACGMSPSVAALRPPALRAVDFLVHAQNPYRGWRYSVKPGDNDTSVTGWCVMALKAAAISDLAPPRTAFDGARAWVASVTDDDGVVGYTGKGKVGVVIPGKNEAWRDHPAMTAVGLLCRIYIDHDPSDALLEKHARVVTADLPRWEAPAKERPIDFYYWYYGALALFQYDAPSGRHWRAWNDAMKRALLPSQASGREGCANGSWDPSVDRWGAVGGRVYATAINTLTMEVYTRYAKVLELERKAAGGR
jgi:hypothetical protein